MNFETLHQATLGELLSIQSIRYSNQPFLLMDDQQWTYAEAELQASALSAGLRELGLQLLQGLREFRVVVKVGVVSGEIQGGFHG